MPCMPKVKTTLCFLNPSKTIGYISFFNIPSCHLWFIAVAKWCILGNGRREKVRLGDTTAVRAVAAATEEEMKSLR